MKTFCVTDLAAEKEVNVMAESPLEALLIVVLQEVYGNFNTWDYNKKYKELQGDVIVGKKTLGYGDWAVLKGA